MYGIMKNGQQLKLADDIQYIKVQPNGCYALCHPNDAEGICAGGQVFMNDAYDYIQSFDGIESLMDVSAMARDQIKQVCAATNTPPSAEIGKAYYGAEPWEAGKTYAMYDLFTHNGSMGWVKQAHTSQETWLPFAVGTESIYGARPVPNSAGVYPYVYNMAVEVGMKVKHEGVVYECIQGTDSLLYSPDQAAALFKVIE